MGEPKCALLTKVFLQIGLWRLAEYDTHHLSVSHGTTGKTAQLYRADGTRHPGPRNDFNTFDITKGTIIKGSDKDCVNVNEVSSHYPMSGESVLFFFF